MPCTLQATITIYVLTTHLAGLRTAVQRCRYWTQAECWGFRKPELSAVGVPSAVGDHYLDPWRPASSMTNMTVAQPHCLHVDTCIFYNRLLLDRASFLCSEYYKWVEGKQFVYLAWPAWKVCCASILRSFARHFVLSSHSREPCINSQIGLGEVDTRCSWRNT
jgi:hypothetical protein